MECYKDDAKDDEQKELEEETIIKDVHEAIQVCVTGHTKFCL